MSYTRRTYLSIGKIAAPVALLGLKIYTKVTNRPRVRVLVENEDGEILLIQNVFSQSKSWIFPGGGVGRSETLVEAACRELYEETGIKKPTSQLNFLSFQNKKETGLSFDVPIFYILVQKNDLPMKLHNPIEIAAVRWFRKDNLPKEISKLIQAAINELDDKYSR